MLRSMKDIEGYAIGATDGVIGHVKDAYFDDRAWVIRYFAVETGTWLLSRKVLISPFSVTKPNWEEKLLPVTISKKQVESSPDIDTEKPVSRQHEIDFLGYYGYPYYWEGAGLWGGGLYPYMMLPGYTDFGTPQVVKSEEKRAYAEAEAAKHDDDDPHLRSCKEITGYHIQASDGEIGHVQGFLIDEETWAIRYLIVKTGNWWVGQQVLIAPLWIDQVSWIDSKVLINLTQQEIKDAPPYDPTIPFERQQEMDTYKHYGRAGYWSEEQRRDTEVSHDWNGRTGNE